MDKEYFNNNLKELQRAIGPAKVDIAEICNWLDHTLLPGSNKLVEFLSTSPEKLFRDMPRRDITGVRAQDMYIDALTKMQKYIRYREGVKNPSDLNQRPEIARSRKPVKMTLEDIVILQENKEHIFPGLRIDYRGKHMPATFDFAIAKFQNSIVKEEKDISGRKGGGGIQTIQTLRLAFESRKKLAEFVNEVEKDVIFERSKKHRQLKEKLKEYTNAEGISKNIKDEKDEQSAGRDFVRQAGQWRNRKKPVVKGEQSKLFTTEELEGLKDQFSSKKDKLMGR